MRERTLFILIPHTPMCWSGAWRGVRYRKKPIFLLAFFFAFSSFFFRSSNSERSFSLFSYCLNHSHNTTTMYLGLAFAFQQFFALFPFSTTNAQRCLSVHKLGSECTFTNARLDAKVVSCTILGRLPARRVLVSAFLCPRCHRLDLLS